MKAVAYHAAVLKLMAATDPRWAERILPDLDAVLVDHAHLEKKAAAGALKLLLQYPDRPSLQDPLSRLAREELGHFEEVVRVLGERGVPLRGQRPSPYFARLHSVVSRHEPARLLDRLLINALIEARSCERLALLADVVDEPTLTHLYRGLLAAEARHHGAYVELARGLFDSETVQTRLEALARHEAAVLAQAPPRPRLHDAGRRP
jgi:tRNA-(ms[2]io[6]A)-hydroxylase